MWHVVGGREMHAGFWWGNLTKGDNLEDLGIDGVVLCRIFFKKIMAGCGLD